MRKYFLLLVIGLALSLCACGATKKTLGLTRQGPDETTVKVNEPLILPPEYNVRPKSSETKTDEAEELFDE